MRGMRWLFVAGMFALLGGGARAADPEAKPLPVDKGTILREEGAVYYVEGRQKIPRGVEISVQKDVKIVARGKSPAVIELEGALEIHGVGAREVILENVWVECAPKFQNLHLDTCIFRGGGGVRTAPKQSVNGRFFVENTSFQAPASLGGTFESNEVDLQTTTVSSPVTLRATVPEGSQGNRAQLLVIAGSYNGGLIVEGFSDVTVRTVFLGGAKSSFKDCEKLTFDGNKIESKELEIRQSVAGRFKDVKMQKCDVYASRIRLWAPVKENLNEQLACDKCWFQGVTDEKELRAKLFVDGEDDGACGVRVDFKKIMERPLELAGGVNR